MVVPGIPGIPGSGPSNVQYKACPGHTWAHQPSWQTWWHRAGKYACGRWTGGIELGCTSGWLSPAGHRQPGGSSWLGVQANRLRRGQEGLTVRSLAHSVPKLTPKLSGGSAALCTKTARGGASSNSPTQLYIAPMQPAPSPLVLPPMPALPGPATASAAITPSPPGITGFPGNQWPQQFYQYGGPGPQALAKRRSTTPSRPGPYQRPCSNAGGGKYSSSYVNFQRLPLAAKLSLLEVLEPVSMNPLYMSTASPLEVACCLYVGTGRPRGAKNWPSMGSLMR